MILTDMVLMSESVAGASHLLLGKECQDSNLSWRSADADIAIMAVSDGHGGDKYFNSSVGASKACEIAVESIRDLCYLKPAHVTDSDIRHLVKHIVAAWRDSVSAADQDADVVSFGCTLIAYAQTPHCSFAIQLGDGLFSALSSDGKWRLPLPNDDRCFLNMTTSMCDVAAYEEFRWQIYNGDNMPSAVVLTTDGIDTTFCDETLLFNFYNHLIVSIAEDGAEKVQKQLPGVLAHYSEIGSKDDMTLGIIIDNSLLIRERTA